MASRATPSDNDEVKFCVAYYQVGRIRLEGYGRSAATAMAKLQEAWERHTLQHPDAPPWDAIRRKVAIEGRVLDRGYRNGERIA
jgi:hypothetical protein